MLLHSVTMNEKLRIPTMSPKKHILTIDLQHCLLPPVPLGNSPNTTITQTRKFIILLISSVDRDVLGKTAIVFGIEEQHPRTEM